MSLTLVWTCDDCDAAVSKADTDQKPLATPDGWTARLHDGRYYHACPDCTRLRRTVGWEDS